MRIEREHPPRGRRLPREQQQCASCGRTIGWFDEVSIAGPVFGDPDEAVRLRHAGKSLARCRQRLGE